LEIALEKLAPYERLACVSYFLDGASTDSIASLFGVPRERAVRILDGAAPAIARAVGDETIPDFAAATDEVDVVTR
jgi:DNA-directed RNA polymerase specialized sigma24 family protein